VRILSAQGGPSNRRIDRNLAFGTDWDVAPLNPLLLRGTEWESARESITRLARAVAGIGAGIENQVGCAGRWAEACIGHDRASRTYAFRTFLNHGVHVRILPPSIAIPHIELTG
jgi:predicted amidohydrolase YtcJ